MTKIDVGDREKAKRMLEIVSSGELNHREEEFTDRDIYDFLENLIDQLDGEWKIIDCEWSSKFSTQNWEINRKGDVRHAQTKTVIEPKWDFDRYRYLVELKNEDSSLYVYGAGLAKLIFKEED